MISVGDTLADSFKWENFRPLIGVMIKIEI